MAHRDQSGNIIIDGNNPGLICGLAVHLDDNLIAQIKAAFGEVLEGGAQAEVGIFYNDKSALMTFDDFLSRIFPAEAPADNKKAAKPIAG